MKWLWAKWVPLVFSGVALVAFSATLSQTQGGQTPSPVWRWMVYRGQFILHRDPAYAFLPPGNNQNLPTEEILDLGFAWRYPGPDELWIEVPLWSFALLLASVPAVYLWLYLWLGLRDVPGQCRHCRYDLTGNHTGRCSECGRAVSRRQPTT